MKKILVFLLLLIPLNIKAAEYDVKSANMKVTFPDDWYVFTRENIEDNENLEKIKVTVEYMNSFFNYNNAYIDAVKSRIEFVLRTTDNVDFASLSDYPDEKVKEIAQDMGAINKTEAFKVYNNKYKYVLLNSKSGDYYITVYATVINNKWYTYTIQKKTEFSADEATEIKKIIDSIDYEIVETISEEEAAEIAKKKEELEKENSKRRIKLIVGYAIVVVIGLAFLGNIILKKRGKVE